MTIKKVTHLFLIGISMIYESMYMSEPKYTQTPYIYKININYALGLVSMFILKGTTLDYGTILSQKYCKEWTKVFKNEPSWLDRLGKSMKEIVETFNALPVITPPITIHTDLNRLCRLNVDERDFYEEYEPLWTPSVHHMAPIGYLYISLAFSARGLNDFKQDVMKYTSILRYKERIERIKKSLDNSDNSDSDTSYD
jgi:hypothetical protein